MTNNLFVGGLPYETTREELTKLFAACGKVNDVKLIMDGFTGRSKGFGFVEMSTEAEAQAAMAKLNGTTLGQRQLFISEARPQEKRPSGLPGKPGFVERRSGLKDRRRQQPAVAVEKRPADMPRQDGAKREGFGGAKKVEERPRRFRRQEKAVGQAGRGHREAQRLRRQERVGRPARTSRPAG